MQDNFFINVIWKEDKILKIDDENLSSKTPEKFFYISEKDKKSKTVFTKKNIFKEILINYLVALIIIVSGWTIMEFWDGPSSDLGTNLCIVILIGSAITVIGLIFSPFFTYKSIFIELNSIGEQQISRVNVFGSKSILVNLKNVTNIQLKLDKLNSYFFIAEKNDIKLSEHSLILVVKNENIELISKMDKFIYDCTQKEIVRSQVVLKNR